VPACAFGGRVFDVIVNGVASGTALGFDTYVKAGKLCIAVSFHAFDGVAVTNDPLNY
jgi:hypothetical protein